MSSYELHIWGPAFGLPSIDAECLAAVAYLHHAIPSSEWTLVPSSDPSVTPSNRLPALHSTSSSPSSSSSSSSGDVWITGYGSIVSHLSSKTPYNLNAGLTPSQLADTAAYTAYCNNRLSPLLDVSFYALPRNWTEVVRPAYSAIIPFPLTWTVPTAVHAAAIERAGHLLAGLSLSDDDNNDASAAADGIKNLGPLDAAMKHLPATARRRKGIWEELAPGQAATIRMHAVADDTLSVLEDLRARGEGAEKDVKGAEVRLGTQQQAEPGTKLRFFTDEHAKVSSLDCLVFGYLALLRAAPVPHDFARNVLASKYPALSVMVDDLAAACIGGPGPLPWSDGVGDDAGALATASKSCVRVLSRFLDGVVRATPQLGEVYGAEVRRWRAEGEQQLLLQRAVNRDDGDEHERGAATKSGVVGYRRTAALVGSVLAAGSALAYGVWWYRNLPPFGLRTQTWAAERAGSKLAGLGALGAMLDSSLGGPPGDDRWPASSGSEPGPSGVAGQSRIVETDVSVE